LALASFAPVRRIAYTIDATIARRAEGSYNANMAEKFRCGGISQRGKIKFCAPCRSTLDERLQPAQCLIPLPVFFAVCAYAVFRRVAMIHIA
jgi:hypothetical protein